MKKNELGVDWTVVEAKAKEIGILECKKTYVASLGVKWYVDRQPDDDILAETAERLMTASWEHRVSSDELVGYICELCSGLHLVPTLSLIKTRLLKDALDAAIGSRFREDRASASIVVHESTKTFFARLSTLLRVCPERDAVRRILDIDSDESPAPDCAYRLAMQFRQFDLARQWLPRAAWFERTHPARSAVWSDSLYPSDVDASGSD